IRSPGARCMYTPRTISSSVRRAQSSASRLVRNVLDAVGQPVLRMTAFQVPEGVLTRVAMRVEAPKSTLGASPLYRNCTWLANLENPPVLGFELKPLYMIVFVGVFRVVPGAGIEPARLAA